MALITNETVTRTRKTVLPDGRTQTVTETTIDSERSAAIARVWIWAGFKFMLQVQGVRILLSLFIVAFVAMCWYHKFGHTTKPGYYSYLAGTPGRNCVLQAQPDGTRGYHCYGVGYPKPVYGSQPATNGSTYERDAYSATQPPYGKIAVTAPYAKRKTAKQATATATPKPELTTRQQLQQRFQQSATKR